MEDNITQGGYYLPPLYLPAVFPHSRPPPVFEIQSEWASDSNATEFWVRFLVREEIFLFLTAFRPQQEPTQPVKWVPMALSPVLERSEREADFQLAPKLRMSGKIPLLPRTFSWREAYLIFNQRERYAMKKCWVT
jgi:hypothetical protein